MPALAERARCAEVAEALPGVLDSRDGPRWLAEHVEGCLACHAELARYRRLLRLLGQLRAERAELPPGLLAELLEAVGAAVERRAIASLLAGRRLAYAGGVLAGCTAAAGLLVLRRGRAARRPANA